MAWCWRPAEPALRRHEMVQVSPRAWRAVLADRRDLAREPLVAGWADRGWPLVTRRPAPGEPPGLALGLPLPPVWGKRRLAVVVDPAEVIARQPPPALRALIDAAPDAWRESLEGVLAATARARIDVRVFGSLAWRGLTGLNYLSDTSDVDLLLPLPAAGRLRRLVDSLARLDALAPMRLDGELVRRDGAAANWREVHGGAADVLVKTLHDVSLAPRHRFLAVRGAP